MLYKDLTINRHTVGIFDEELVSLITSYYTGAQKKTNIDKNTIQVEPETMKV